MKKLKKLAENKYSSILTAVTGYIALNALGIIQGTFNLPPIAPFIVVIAVFGVYLGIIAKGWVAKFGIILNLLLIGYDIFLFLGYLAFTWSNPKLF